MSGLNEVIAAVDLQQVESALNQHDPALEWDLKRDDEDTVWVATIQGQDAEGIGSGGSKVQALKAAYYDWNGGRTGGRADSSEIAYDYSQMNKAEVLALAKGKGMAVKKETTKGQAEAYLNSLPRPK